MMRISIDLFDRLAQDALNGRWSRATRTDMLLAYLQTVTNTALRDELEDELIHGLHCDPELVRKVADRGRYNA